jgi:hypothetical protein
MIVSQDHSIWAGFDPKDVVLGEETVGTRYVLSPGPDLSRSQRRGGRECEARARQDAITVVQADKGTFEDPDWKKKDVGATREKINVVAAALPDSGRFDGRGPNHQIRIGISPVVALPW